MPSGSLFVMTRLTGKTRTANLRRGANETLVSACHQAQMLTYLKALITCGGGFGRSATSDKAACRPRNRCHGLS